ncbi:hypothetical protein SLEP1_g53380 [Rubroshorea leprosula]|uniref:Uncharacterized protein n=1 Tax=Rubroshorea leprosula TaxID=152421 RepID=A0AAV5MB14_9ROSI|nr:hypothetical protein SLEP1_g53380 [Rubroshorea leprosula]
MTCDCQYCCLRSSLVLDSYIDFYKCYKCIFLLLRGRLQTLQALRRRENSFKKLMPFEFFGESPSAILKELVAEAAFAQTLNSL